MVKISKVKNINWGSNKIWSTFQTFRPAIDGIKRKHLKLHWGPQSFSWKKKLEHSIYKWPYNCFNYFITKNTIQLKTLHTVLNEALANGTSHKSLSICGEKYNTHTQVYWLAILIVYTNTVWTCGTLHSLKSTRYNMCHSATLEKYWPTHVTTKS